MNSSKMMRVGVIVAGLFLVGCGAGSKLTRLDNVSKDEAIVAGKFRIKYNGEDVTKGCDISIRPMYTQRLDESGYVFAKLPVGAHSVWILTYSYMQHRFDTDDLTFQLKGGGAINYIGDITMDWKGMSKGSGLALGVAVGGWGNILGATKGKMVVSVKSNPEEIQAEIRRRFNSDQKVTPSLMVVKPGL